MAGRPGKRTGNSLLIWVVGLILGVAIGTLTAALLLPRAGHSDQLIAGLFHQPASPVDRSVHR